MSSKRIVVETEERRRLHFKFESGRIYKVTIGTFVDGFQKIGEADSLDDAIQIIKATLDDGVRGVEVKNW